MRKITYKVNGGKVINVDHCQVLSENTTEITVLINGELERTIKKSKIVESIDIDEKMI